MSATTWNSADATPPSSASGWVLSESDRLATWTEGLSRGGIRATQGRDVAATDLYFEVDVVSAPAFDLLMVGLSALSELVQSWWFGPDGYGYNHEGRTFNAGASLGFYGDAYGAGANIGFLIRNAALYIRLDGVWQGGADPDAETGAAYTGLVGTLYPSVATEGNCSFRGRFDDGDFVYVKPLGAEAWGGAAELAAAYQDSNLADAYILLMELYFDGGYHVARVASDWWYSKPTDTIGVCKWEGRITSEPTYGVQLGCVIWGTKTSISVGAAEVADPADELDWLRRRTRDSLCVLRLALPGQSYDDTILVGKAIVDSVESTGLTKVVNLRGIDTLFDRPLQSTVFQAEAATSETEPASSSETPIGEDGKYGQGSSAPPTFGVDVTTLEGDKVPVVLGRVWQHEPPLVNTQHLWHQVTDAGISEIFQVMSGGSVANPPDSSNEDWDYILSRSGFAMSTNPTARITVNCSGIRALSAPLLSSRFSTAAAWNSDALIDWSASSASGQEIRNQEGIGLRLLADSGELTGPSITYPSGVSEDGWVVVLIEIADITSGYLRISLGESYELRRDGRHSLIATMGYAGELIVEAVPDSDGCDITIASVHLYQLDDAETTESLVEMVRHITVARGALPDAATVQVPVIGEAFASSGDIDAWTPETSGVASIGWSAGVATLSAGDGATVSAARLVWPALLTAGERYTFGADVNNTTITGRPGFAGVQAFFRPASLAPANYISLGERTTTGAQSFSATFEPTESGYLVIETVTSNMETAVTEVDNITLTRLAFDDDGTTVDFNSLAAIDDGYTFGLVSDGAETVREALSRVLDSIAGWFYPDTQGRIRFGRLQQPSGAPVLTISDNNLISYPAPKPNLAQGLSDVWAGGKNWSPYSDSELAGITYPNRPPFRAAYRERKVSASAREYARPYTHAIGAAPIETLVYDGVSLQIEADRVGALHVEQDLFHVVEIALESAAAAQAIRADVPVLLDSATRFGADNGKLATIIGIEGRYRSQVLKLTVLPEQS